MTDSSSAHDAHVQVLTAEVRTLMVGSRQVTLSVFEQLDAVRWDDGLEPFGRVRPKSARDWQVHVVGRDPETGALARSWLPSIGRLASLQNEVARVRADPAQYPNGEGPMAAALDYELGDISEDSLKQMISLSLRWGQLPLIVLAGLR